VVPKEPVRVQPTVHSQSARPSDDFFVLPALAVPTPPPVTVETVHRPAFPTLDKQVESLRAANVRLRYLQVRVHDGRVYLSGWVYNWADLHQLTAAVALLPGVRHVIVGEIRMVTTVARREG
jgi:hypothetical protein